MPAGVVAVDCGVGVKVGAGVAGNVSYEGARAVSSTSVPGGVATGVGVVTAPGRGLGTG
jgi:hypothetical protein